MTTISHKIRIIHGKIRVIFIFSIGLQANSCNYTKESYKSIFCNATTPDKQGIMVYNKGHKSLKLVPL